MYWIYGAIPQDLSGLVAMFQISSTIYSKISNHTGFMRASNMFCPYNGIASEYSILGTRVFLNILCSTKKWGNSPSTLGAWKSLLGIYIGVISLCIITLPEWSFMGMSSREDNPRIWANWDNFTPSDSGVYLVLRVEDRSRVLDCSLVSQTHVLKLLLLVWLVTLHIWFLGLQLFVRLIFNYMLLFDHEV
jgi:hypothetical protein